MSTAAIPAAPPRLARRTPRGLGRARQFLHCLAGHAVLGLVAMVVALVGLDLRMWAWRATEPIRFVQDIDNAFRQGTRTLSVGYIERYDNNATEEKHAWVPMGLDYGPGRLAIATLWAHWVRTQVTAPSNGPDPITDQWTTEFYPYVQQIGRTYELCRPLLMVNLTGEALSALAMFLLVRRYTSDRGTRPARGNVLGLLSASLFWLDPALLSNAHAWPQWDSWVLPFTLWALLLASLDCWFCAGVAIAIGAMFKGQVLFGAAMFLLWPLWQGRFGSLARWTAGLATGVAAATAVWLVRKPGYLHGFLYVPGRTNPAAVGWVVDAALVALLVIVAVRLPGPWVRRVTPVRWAGWSERDPHALRIGAAVAGLVALLAAGSMALLAAVWLSVAVSPGTGWTLGAVGLCLFARAAWMSGVIPAHWPARVEASHVLISILLRVLLGTVAALVLATALAPIGIYPWCSFAAVAALGLLAYFNPARSLGPIAAAWVAASLLLCLPLFGGSSEWFEVGIAHGTTARNRMSNGENNNLAKLLEQYWGWQLEDPAVTLPAGPTSDRVGAFLRAIDRHVELPRGRPVSLPLKYLLVLIWVTATAGCAFGAARHDRRRDPRFLVAVIAPWIVMFAVMGQMHQRYLLWGAALSCVAAGVDPGLVALHLLLSVVSAGQELADMVGTTAAFTHRDPAQVVRDLAGDSKTSTAAWWVHTLYRTVTGWTPGMGWAVLLTACVFVYVAVMPGRRRITSACSEQGPNLNAAEEEPE